MIDRRILAVVSALAMLVLTRPATVLSQAIQWSIYVSVVDHSGAPVPDLSPSDFIVREDGVPREVLRVAPADDPMQIAILVDNSRAAGGEISNIRRALPPFVEALTRPTASGGRNQVAIVGLADRPTFLADYTSDRAPLEQAIDRIWEEPFSGSYLLDATIEVSQGFKKRKAARPVIVAITTEGPEFSGHYFELVLTALGDAGAAFHVIALGRPSTGVGDDARNRNTVLDEGPRMSGGIREQLLVGTALPGKLQQLGGVLTHQYRVTYAHPDSLIQPERVTVSARRSDLTARGTLVKDQQARR